MKKITILSAAILLLATGCGMLTLPTATESTSSTTSTTETTESTSSSSSSSTIGNVLGSILGSLTQSTTESTIVGTWTYKEPDVKFSSDNLLAKAGGTVASAKVIQKIEPYYEKVGIKPGKMSVTLNSDKTCSYTLKSKTYQGTYTFDKDNGTLVIKGTAFSFPTAYVSVSGSQMSLTFDSTKILSLVKSMGSLSSDSSTLSTISSLAQSFDGMKTGFLFTK